MVTERHAEMLFTMIKKQHAEMLNRHARPHSESAHLLHGVCGRYMEHHILVHIHTILVLIFATRPHVNRNRRRKHRAYRLHTQHGSDWDLVAPNGAAILELLTLEGKIKRNRSA